MTVRTVRDGTQSTVIDTTGATVADGNFSTTAQATQFDNTGASDKWPDAEVVFTGQFATITGVGGEVIELYQVNDDIDGTADENPPNGGTAQDGSHFVASFRMPDDIAATTDVSVRETISMEGVEKARFYLKNVTGQTLTAGATVKLEGFSVEDV